MDKTGIILGKRNLKWIQSVLSLVACAVLLSPLISLPSSPSLSLPFCPSSLHFFCLLFFFFISLGNQYLGWVTLKGGKKVELSFCVFESFYSTQDHITSEWMWFLHRDLVSEEKTIAEVMHRCMICSRFRSKCPVSQSWWQVISPVEQSWFVCGTFANIWR